MDAVASRKAKASFLSLQIVAATLSSVVSDRAHDCGQLAAYKKFDDHVFLPICHVFTLFQ
jgi:hypothetical protein